MYVPTREQQSERRRSDPRQVQILENQDEVFDNFDNDDEEDAADPQNEDQAEGEDDWNFNDDDEDVDGKPSDLGGSRHGTENESRSDEDI